MLTHSLGTTTSNQLVYAFGYDIAGRLTKLTVPTGINTQATGAMTYDADDQLLTNTLTSDTYAYDAEGNRTSADGAAYGAPAADNQLSNDGTYSYTYDADGNLTAKTRLDATGKTLYTYDFRNRLTSVVTYTGTGGFYTLQQTAAYTYDDSNRRISQIVTNAAGGTTLSEAYYYDGSQLLLVTDLTDSTVKQRYFNGAQPNEILAEETVSGGTSVVRWALQDQEQSVRDVMDYGGGLLDHITYDSFGNIKSQTSPANAIRMGYTGQVFDATTGLSYDNARFYDPNVGRFLNTDPKGFAAGDTNTYRYVGNNPFNLTDPSGMTAFGWGGSITGGTADVSSPFAGLMSSGTPAPSSMGNIDIDSPSNIATSAATQAANPASSPSSWQDTIQSGWDEYYNSLPLDERDKMEQAKTQEFFESHSFFLDPENVDPYMATAVAMYEHPENYSSTTLATAGYSSNYSGFTSHALQFAGGAALASSSLFTANPLGFALGVDQMTAGFTSIVTQTDVPTVTSSLVGQRGEMALTMLASMDLTRPIDDMVYPEIVDTEVAPSIVDNRVSPSYVRAYHPGELDPIVSAPRSFQLPTSAVTETPVNLTIRGQAIQYQVQMMPTSQLEIADGVIQSPSVVFHNLYRLWKPLHAHENQLSHARSLTVASRIRSHQRETLH